MQLAACVLLAAPRTCGAVRCRGPEASVSEFYLSERPLLGKGCF